jgi:hypothetical protein
MAASLRARRAADAAAYALLVALVTFCLTWAVGLVTGRGLVGAKWGMFLVGMTMLAYGALRLRVATPLGSDAGADGGGADGSAGRSGRGGGGPGTDAGGLLVRAAPRLLPPGLRLPAAERHPAGAKLLLAAVVVLAWSLALEVVFGVGVAA